MIWRSIRHEVKNRDGQVIGSRVDQYAIQSGCGRYIIAKVTVDGADQYEAAFDRKLIARGRTLEIVKQACAAHSGEQVAA